MCGARLQNGIVADLCRQSRLDTCGQQKRCLGGVTRHLQSGGNSRFSNAREIDPCRDVLQARPQQRIIVGTMPVKTPEGAGTALRQVILATGKTVVEQQRGTGFSQPPSSLTQGGNRMAISDA